MLMADPAKALTETRRVLRDGGRLGSRSGRPRQELWAAVPGMALVERGLFPPPEPGAPGIFAIGDPDRIRELVTGAGFGEPEIEHVEIKWPYEDADEHWHFTLKLAGPLADAIQQARPMTSRSRSGRTSAEDRAADESGEVVRHHSRRHRVPERTR